MSKRRHSAPKAQPHPQDTMKQALAGKMERDVVRALRRTELRDRLPMPGKPATQASGK